MSTAVARILDDLRERGGLQNKDIANFVDVSPATRRQRMLRLSEMDVLQELGVDVKNYGGMDYSRTQAIADCAFFLGFDSLIVPSARSRNPNLVLFADHLDVADTDVEHSEGVDWKAWRRSR